MSRQVSVTLPTHLADELEQRVVSGVYIDRSEIVTGGLRELPAREEAVDAQLHGDVAPAYDGPRVDLPLALNTSQVRVHIAAHHSRRTFEARGRSVTRCVGYSPQAQRHLTDLYDWIAHESGFPDRAEAYATALMDRCDTSANFPMAGRAHDDIRPGLRTIRFRRRAVIVLAITDEMIEIIGVYYGGCDYSPLLCADDERLSLRTCVRCSPPR